MTTSSVQPYDCKIKNIMVNSGINQWVETKAILTMAVVETEMKHIFYIKNITR